MLFKLPPALICQWNFFIRGYTSPSRRRVADWWCVLPNQYEVSGLAELFKDPTICSWQMAWQPQALALNVLLSAANLNPVRRTESRVFSGMVSDEDTRSAHETENDVSVTWFLMVDTRPSQQSAKWTRYCRGFQIALSGMTNTDGSKHTIPLHIREIVVHSINQTDLSAIETQQNHEVNGHVHITGRNWRLCIKMPLEALPGFDLEEQTRVAVWWACRDVEQGADHWAQSIVLHPLWWPQLVCIASD